MRISTRPILIAVAAAGLATVSCVSGEIAPVTTTTTTPFVPEATTILDDEELTTTTTAIQESPSRGRAADLPVPRTEVAGAVWADRIVVVGGLDGGGGTSDRSDFYDLETDTWARGPDLPVPLHHTAVATLGDRVYVVGGYSTVFGRWEPEAAVWSLGPDEESWRPEPDLVTPRGALAVVSSGDRLVAFGGVGPDGQFLTSTETLQAGDDLWRPGPDLIEPREHLAAAAVGDLVYAIAGRNGGMATNKSSVEVLGTERWEEAPALIFSRGGIGATAVGGVPCVAGGEESEGTLATIECLIDGDWAVVEELEFARHGLVVVAVDGVLHVIGGGPEPGLTVSDVHEVIPIVVEP